MPAELPRPILTVDVVLLTFHEARLQVVLQTRDKSPHAGRSALIGGHVHPQEDASTTAAAVRVLREKAGATARLLEQLMTFSSAEKDPRGWSASVTYYALMPAEALPPMQAKGLRMCPLARACGLPFDHDLILDKAADRWRRRAAYSSLPAFLLPEIFTMTDLRLVYEEVLRRALNDSALRRKVDELRVIEPVEGATSKATARPAQLYRLRHEGLIAFDRTV